MFQGLAELEEIREEINASQAHMARKLGVNLETYQDWLTGDVEPSVENKFKIDDLLIVLQSGEFVHCNEKDLFVWTYDRDEFKHFKSCPICNNPNCEWGYKSFAEAFDFEDIEGPDPEELCYWIEDKRIIIDLQDDERFEGAIEKIVAP